MLTVCHGLRGENMIKFFTMILMFFCANANSFEIIGRLPPATHTLENGTFTPFDSQNGARRYFEVVESTICNAEPTLITPSTTFNVAKGGLFKSYRSPNGVRAFFPVSFAKECHVPESGDVIVPAPPKVDFTGLTRISINPTPTDPNDCTFLEWRVTAKNVDDVYTMEFIRWYDASQDINGVRTCPYQ